MKKYLVVKEGTLNGFDVSSDPTNAYCEFPEDLPVELAECVDVLLPDHAIVVNPHLVQLKEKRDSVHLDTAVEEAKPKKSFLSMVFGR